MSTEICIHGNDPMTCDERPDGRCHVPKRPCPECGKDATEVCVHMQRLLAAIGEPRRSTDDEALAAIALAWHSAEHGHVLTVDFNGQLNCRDCLDKAVISGDGLGAPRGLLAALGVTPTEPEPSKTPATAVDTRIKPSHHGSGNDETAAVAGPNNPLAPCCCAVSNGYDWIYATTYSHCGACVAGHHDKCTAVGAVPVDEPPAETNNQNAHIRDNPSEGVPR